MRTLSMAFLGVLLAQLSPGQEAPKLDKAVFFSGSVIALTPTTITVRRRALVSNAASKTFAMDGETRIEGKLRVKATVTVRYLTEDDGQARAVHIIVR